MDEYYCKRCGTDIDDSEITVCDSCAIEEDEE